MTIEITVIVGVLGGICSIAFGYIGYQRGIKAEGYKSGEKDGTVIADIQYIKKRIDDVLLEQRDTKSRISSLAERVTRVEEKSNEAHKRIDRLENEKCKQV